LLALSHLGLLSSLNTILRTANDLNWDNMIEDRLVKAISSDWTSSKAKTETHSKPH